MFSLDQIAQTIGGRVIGKKSLTVSDVNEVAYARRGELGLCFRDEDMPFAVKTKASALVVTKEISICALPQIVVKEPRLAIVQLLELFTQQKKLTGISKHAVVDKTARVDKTAFIGDFVSIGADCIIGKNTTIYSGVKIYPHVRIGNYVIIHANSVIGADGFGYVWDGKTHRKMIHRGGVVIEDHVEIGANSAVDQGTLRPTVIGQGSKLDNFVHVAHNVTIGKNVILVSQANIAGNSTLEDNVVIAGKSGVADYVKLGKGTTVLACSGVIKDFPANSIVSGFPARSHREQLKIQAMLDLLPKWKKILEKLDVDEHS